MSDQLNIIYPPAYTFLENMEKTKV